MTEQCKRGGVTFVTEMIKAHSVKNGITLVKLDFPFAVSGHWTWELKGSEHSLGAIRSLGRPYKMGGGRPLPQGSGQGKVRPPPAISSRAASSAAMQSADLARGGRELIWLTGQLDNLGQVSLHHWTSISLFEK